MSYIIITCINSSLATAVITTSLVVYFSYQHTPFRLLFAYSVQICLKEYQSDCKLVFSVFLVVLATHYFVIPAQILPVRQRIVNATLCVFVFFFLANGASPVSASVNRSILL